MSAVETSPQLEDIIARGNKPQMTVEAMRAWEPRPNWLFCADGFRFSVIAGDGAYCTPRPSAYSILGEAPADYPGPYTAVEVGFPSQRPEPWTQWAEWAESTEDPTDTVYAYVPVDALRELVALHGGVVAAGMSPSDGGAA